MLRSGLVLNKTNRERGSKESRPELNPRKEGRCFPRRVAHRVARHASQASSRL